MSTQQYEASSSGSDVGNYQPSTEYETIQKMHDECQRKYVKVLGKCMDFEGGVTMDLTRCNRIT